MPIAIIRKGQHQHEQHHTNHHDATATATAASSADGDRRRDRHDLGSSPVASSPKSLAYAALSRLAASPNDVLTVASIVAAVAAVVVALLAVHEWDRARQADLEAAVGAHRRALEEWARWDYRSGYQIEQEYDRKLYQCRSVRCRLDLERWRQIELDHSAVYEKLYSVLKDGASLEALFRSQPRAKSWSTRDVIEALYTQVVCRNQTRQQRLVKSRS